MPKSVPPIPFLLQGSPTTASVFWNDSQYFLKGLFVILSNTPAFVHLPPPCGPGRLRCTMTCSKSCGPASSTQAIASESKVRKETKSLAPCREELHTLRKQDFIPLEDSTTVTASQSSVSPAQAGPNWQLCTGAKTSVPSQAQALTVPRKTTFTGKWIDSTLWCSPGSSAHLPLGILTGSK